ncbi:MAG: rhodanese-like domain-containing protein [Chloroflexi bacterium]|nr:rhodanese-like domain-containing protein [Chloroflexota bacterium]
MSKARSKQAAQRQTNTKWLWIGLAVVAVVIIAALAVSQLTNRGTAVLEVNNLPAEISVAQAVAMRDEGAFILDVRQPEEWTEFHVPDSTLIPLGELSARVNEVPRDRQVVVVCRSGNRSQQGRDILRQAGFTQVTSMSGGLREWQAQGYPTVTGS